MTNQQPTIDRIHHVTAIASDPQANVDFYSGLLGLRLVKQTVNFDDPGSYHLYYGDGVGNPSTIMTFFAWPGAPRGRQGVGQVVATSFAIPASSLDYWASRLAAHGTESGAPITRFGDVVLPFEDPDGLSLELIASAAPDSRQGWTGTDIPAEHVLRGFHSATMMIASLAASTLLLSDVMGFRAVGRDGDRERYEAVEGGPGTLIDVIENTTLGTGRQAAGTVHHIAWSTPDDANETRWRATLTERGIDVTDIRDRQYFHSIYYREPGGVLFEIATDTPGFTIDETPAALGTELRLPPWLEHRRSEIARTLPPLHVARPAQTR